MRPDDAMVLITASLERKAEIQHQAYRDAVMVFGGLTYPMNAVMLDEAARYVVERTEARRAAVDEWWATR